MEFLEDRTVKVFKPVNLPLMALVFFFFFLPKQVVLCINVSVGDIKLPLLEK